MKSRLTIPSLFLLAIPLSACTMTEPGFLCSLDEKTNQLFDDSAPILITEQYENMPSYHIIGQVRASSEASSSLSPNPTQKDVDCALRAEAAKIHADAVINVQYQPEEVNLREDGRMTGTGTAVVFIK